MVKDCLTYQALSKALPVLKVLYFFFLSFFSYYVHSTQFCAFKFSIYIYICVYVLFAYIVHFVVCILFSTKYVKIVEK